MFLLSMHIKSIAINCINDPSINDIAMTGSYENNYQRASGSPSDSNEKEILLYRKHDKDKEGSSSNPFDAATTPLNSLKGCPLKVNCI